MCDNVDAWKIVHRPWDSMDPVDLEALVWLIEDD